jgi:uncharacterized protein (UPF0147 family)
MAGDVACAPSYNKWEAEDDLRTLTRAREIQKDENRMKNVRRAAKEKLAEMKSYEDYAKGAEK